MSQKGFEMFENYLQIIYFVYWILALVYIGFEIKYFKNIYFWIMFIKFHWIIFKVLRQNIF